MTTHPMSLKTIRLLTYAALLVSIASCTRYKDLVLLQGTDHSDTTMFRATPPDYRIQNRDILFIRIYSLNQEMTQIINATNTLTQSQFTNEAGLYIYGYNVSDSGFVEIPIIGQIMVQGKTLEDAKSAIATQTEKFLKDATVVVKLISFKFSVLGEVNNPGVYQNYNNQLTVLEAISKAGDISPYGDRKRILVIRPTPEGTETYQLDLTDKELLNSEGFFLLPNDIVYAEPVRSYNFRVNIPTISVILAGISTLVLVLSFVDSN